MKPVGHNIPNRPIVHNRRIPKSRTKAAAELLQSEFERARLHRDLAGLRHRTKRSTAALSAVDNRSALLLAHLNIEEGRD
ncbi:MAG: hypothetical protein AAGB10_20905 [Pseudomonadota bacterium]